MKVTTPADLKLEIEKLAEEAIEKFEEQLKRARKGQYTYSLTIDGTIEPEVRTRIYEIYTQAGWKMVSLKGNSSQRDGDSTTLHLGIFESTGIDR